VDFSPTKKILWSWAITQIEDFNKFFYVFRNTAFNFMLNQSSTYPLRPVNTNNTRPSRITATAGTRLVGAYSMNNVMIFFIIRVLRPESLLLNHPQDKLDQAFASCPIFPIADLRRSLDLYFYSNVAGRSHKPAKDNRLGRPWPYT